MIFTRSPSLAGILIAQTLLLLLLSCSSNQESPDNSLGESTRDYLSNYRRDDLYTYKTRFRPDLEHCLSLPPAVWERARYGGGYFWSLLHRTQAGFPDDSYQCHIDIEKLSIKGLATRRSRLSQALENPSKRWGELNTFLYSTHTEVAVFQDDYHRFHYRLDLPLPNGEVVAAEITYENILTPHSGRLYRKYDEPVLIHILENLRRPLASGECELVSPLPRPPLLINLREQP